MIKVKILLDSINSAGNRLTTWELMFPRFLLAEINTHRMLSRNAASSRAIPVEKMIAAVRENPQVFEQFGKVNKGMSATDLMEGDEIEDFKADWAEMAHAAADWAQDEKDFAAKQMVNRVLEPFMHTTIICSGTEWSNFYALRAHPAAQPEFQVLAYRMLDAYLKSVPRKIEEGKWHIPLIGETDQHEDSILLKIATARCARVSYTTHNSVKDVEDDIVLHDRLLASGHMSPFEHCAYATNTALRGNFRGWTSYRSTIPNENRDKVDLQAILDSKPDWVKLEA
jgi:thymidylate synthase ThyX